MKSLKAAARRGAMISATAAAALALVACSGGQITQTSSQVAPVDGTSAATEDGIVAVRDVAIQVDPTTGDASLKFTAVNQGYKEETVSLESIDVDGQSVSLGSLQPMNRDQRIVGNSAAELELHNQADGDYIQYVETSLQDDDFGFAGYRPVTFTFSNGSLTMDAAITAPQMEAGKYNRDVENAEGYTTEQPSAHDEHH